MSSPAEHQAFSANTQEGTVGRTEEKEERRGGGEGKEWRGDVEESERSGVERGGEERSGRVSMMRS